MGLSEKDSIWLRRSRQDPSFLQAEKKKGVLQKKLKLTKQMTLPSLTAGYNHQGVPSSYYSGFYAGLSLPLWSSRKQVSAVRSQLVSTQIQTATQQLEEKHEFEQSYNALLNLKEDYIEYQTILSDIDPDKILEKAEEEGEAYFLKWHEELAFYRGAYDEFIAVEFQFFQSKAALLSYDLPTL
jgi:hypothetical protein